MIFTIRILKYSTIISINLVLNFTQAQIKGIRFEQDLSWLEVIEKATREDKYIFVDVVASWCGPCKSMDKETYISEKVGEYMSKKFISIKVQIDSTNDDNVKIRNWYKDASNIKKRYEVSAFPTFLFFSPKGVILHRDIGYKSSIAFLELAKDALNPKKQYYNLLDDYKQERIDYKQMPYLINIATSQNDLELRNSLVRDYLTNYLYKLSDQEILKPRILEFIWPYIKSSKDRIFKIIYNNADQINIMFNNDRLAQTKIEGIISKEEIYPRLWYDPKNWTKSKPVQSKPNWDKLKQIIQAKYSKAYAERIIAEAQILWYFHYKKDWSNATKYYIQKIENYGLNNAISGFGYTNVNEMIWYLIFEHSNDSIIINKGIKWIEEIIKDLEKRGLGFGFNEASIFDTYANLLHKAGRKQEAITWELKAIEISKKDKNEKRVQQFLEVLRKIENSIPTWPVKK